MNRRFCLFLLSLLSVLPSAAAENLRRAVSPSQPAWIIHIDVWNYADPQKVIDMVPDDVRPYVIFNIATSSSDDKSPSGPAVYDSWLKVCAQNRVWAMIQCASGAVNRMPDDGSTAAYEQYFRDYPNFLGFNFAEQFWGFGEEGRVSFPQRLQLFADLLPVCHKYGGYLAVSFTDSYYSSSKMPIAYLKRNKQMRDFLSTDPEHFLCFEKYTLKKNFFDIESNCFGQWLGGYAGQYGIRFDSSGWLSADDVTDQTRGGSPFVRAAGAIPIAEHVMLTGQTMIDGPELTWTECSQETAATTVDGFTSRNWGWFPQFENISLDLFRKIIDGTITIPSRQEVIYRTKVCLLNDVNKNLNNEGEHDSYITPETLFDGLYRQDADRGGAPNSWIANRWWLKSTGRYPSIPMVYAEVEGLTAFRKSQFDKAAFDSWMQQTFPEEYSGDIFAARRDNAWVTYNPYQYDETTADGYRLCSASTRRAEGQLPFHYNSCEGMTLSYAPYSLGIVKEYPDYLSLYLTNYQTDGTVSEDRISVTGVSSQPAVSWTDRGNHAPSTVESVWEDGVLTIVVRHNGPLDIVVECMGEGRERPAVPQRAAVVAPDAPAPYSGVLQYEAELADYRSATLRKSGYNQGRDGYYGQGFVELTSRQSALRFLPRLEQGGHFLLTLRYQADSQTAVVVNGSETLSLKPTDGWGTASTIVWLKDREADVTLQNDGSPRIYADCITLEPIEVEDFTADGNGEFHADLSKLRAAGSISYDDDTHTATLSAGNGQSGALRMYFDHADFTAVTSMQVSYEGDGDIFRYLLITDADGNSVNPSGSQGAFWSSKYSLSYDPYQQAEASRAVCRMEWSAGAPDDEPRQMTIKDIVIKTRANTSALDAITADGAALNRYYNLQGQLLTSPRPGINILKVGNRAVKIKK